MPLLPSALPPKGEARRYVANDFLNLIALLSGERAEGGGSPKRRERISWKIGIKGIGRTYDSDEAAATISHFSFGRSFHLQSKG